MTLLIEFLEKSDQKMSTVPLRRELVMKTENKLGFLHPETILK